MSESGWVMCPVLRPAPRPRFRRGSVSGGTTHPSRADLRPLFGAVLERAAASQTSSPRSSSSLHRSSRVPLTSGLPQGSQRRLCSAIKWYSMQHLGHTKSPEWLLACFMRGSPVAGEKGASTGSTSRSARCCFATRPSCRTVEGRGSGRPCRPPGLPHDSAGTRNPRRCHTSDQRAHHKLRTARWFRSCGSAAVTAAAREVALVWPAAGALLAGRLCDCARADVWPSCPLLELGVGSGG